MSVHFFSSTWLEGFLWSNKFLNLCFQGKHKQRQASSQGQARANKQANNFSFFHLQWF
jgi:hypothetical protein